MALVLTAYRSANLAPEAFLPGCEQKGAGEVQGTKQLALSATAFLFNTHKTPIPSALESVTYRVEKPLMVNFTTVSSKCCYKDAFTPQCWGWGVAAKEGN